MEPDSRELILETALGLFSRRGYEGVGIQEIVDQAGLTKPTLYYHFGSKQGLLEEIVRRDGTALAALCRRAVEYRHDLVMNLRSLFEGCLDFARSRSGFWRLMLSLFSSPPDSPEYTAGAALRGELFGILEKLFEGAAEDHGNMRGRQRIYAESFLALVETFGLLSANAEIPADQDLRFRIVHQYMHGIFS